MFSTFLFYSWVSPNKKKKNQSESPKDPTTYKFRHRMNEQKIYKNNV